MEPFRTEGPEHRQAIHHWHPEVGDDELGAALVGPLVQQCLQTIEQVGPICQFDHVVAIPP